MENPIDARTEKAAQTASDGVAQVIQLAIMSSGNRAMDAAVYVAAVGCSSGIHLLASLCGNCPLGDLKNCQNDENHSPLSHINPTSTMFASILVAAAGSDPIVLGSKDDYRAGFSFEFGPDVILQALELTEKVMGHNPDKYLNEKMVRTVREIEKGANDPLGKFLARKPSTPSSPN